MKRFVQTGIGIFFFIFSLIFTEAIYAQHSMLRKQGSATQLLVKGEPFLVLGGELGNSSAANSDDIGRIFPKLQRMGLNTVLVPAYWDLIEPEEGVYDFSLTDKVISQARINNLKVIFLWFGAWKNSMSCYAPLWFKRDHKKYPRAQTREGKPMEIASAFSENVFQADNRAFSQWLAHIASVDKETGTVIMIQIENEIGMLESARDHSPEADKLFNSPVPQEFLSYLGKNKESLHPRMAEKWAKQGFLNKGNWQDIFGSDVYTDEVFMAWHYAKYVERMAQSARSIFPVPLFVNAAMNSRNRKPGEYPSAGPLAHLIDVWRCAAPHIDFLAPDLYDDGFTDWVAQYHLPNNPLFIPEIKLADNNGVRAFYIFGQHDAIGFSPFSIEDASESSETSFVKGYASLFELMPLLTYYQGKGVTRGVLFEQNNQECTIVQDGLKIICRHYFTLPWDPRARDGSTWAEGGGILLKIAPYEYIVAGSGLVVEFKDITEKKAQKLLLGEDGFAQSGSGSSHVSQAIIPKWKGKRIGIGSVDEVRVNKDRTLTSFRRLNGDQTHQGRHVRIPVGEFSILHVKLYEYQ